MKLLPFATYEAARAADQRAFTLLKQDDGASGGQWSGVYLDAGTALPYAILFDPDIAAAFTALELGKQDLNGDYANVVEGERVKRDDQGKFISGNWETYLPPVEVLP